MKFRFNFHYNTIAAYVVLVFAVCLALVAVVFRFSALMAYVHRLFKVIAPITWGIVIAYLSTPLLTFFEKYLKKWINRKKEHNKLIRVISIFLCMSILILSIVGIVYAVIPEIISSMKNIFTLLPDYLSNLQQYLTNRFGVDSRTLQLVCALIFLFAYTIYVASALVAGPSVFNTLFPEISPKVAMLVFLLIIVAYTFFGGFTAVCWTDFFQGMLMMLALMLVPIVVYFGHRELLDPTALTTVYEYTDAASGAVVSCDFGGGIFSASWQDIVSGLGWGLGYFGMPHILLRFMAIEDEKKLVLSRRIASVWVVIAMTASIVIGMVGLGMTKAGALEFLSGSSSETLIVRVASLIAQHGVLAAILAGLILAGILAATMSTADSQMLAAASSVSQNILQEFGHMKLTEKQSLFAARLTIICISVVGVVLARDPNSSVFGIVSFAWAGFGGAFGAVVLCALFWKRCNWQGALAGMLCGGLMVFVWKYLISPLGGVFGIYELLPAFLFSLAACVVVSLATPAPGADIEAEFKAAK